MFIEMIKLIFLCLIHGGYLMLSMPAYVFLSVYDGCHSGFDYNKSYLCYMVLIGLGACYCFSEMIAYTTPMAHIYVLSTCYLLTCFILGAALSLSAINQPVLTTIESMPEAAHYYLQTGHSLHFKYAGANQAHDKHERIGSEPQGYAI